MLGPTSVQVLSPEVTSVKACNSGECRHEEESGQEVPRDVFRSIFRTARAAVGSSQRPLPPPQSTQTSKNKCSQPATHGGGGGGHLVDGGVDEAQLLLAGGCGKGGGEKKTTRGMITRNT